jgi:uncharacterized membrane protein YvbJ
MYKYRYTCVYICICIYIYIYLCRVFFVQNKIISATVRQSVDRENMHQINLLRTSSENEKKLAETEKIQLRSLVCTYICM